MNLRAPLDAPERLEALLRSAEARAMSEPAPVGSDDENLQNDKALFLSANRESQRLAVLRSSLPPGLSSDWTWLILLDVFVSDARERPESLSGISERWGIAMPTAARCIAALIEARLVFRVTVEPAAEDFTLQLTPHGRSTVRKVLTLIE